MQAISFSKLAIAGGIVLLLGSCDAPTGSQNGFQKQYVVARDALENGQYARASRAYGQLMKKAGPLRPRLQLEYAHSELRAGNYAEAARLASDLAQNQKGQDRAAALSVQGTAQHELGLTMLQKGDAESGKTLLRAADKALSEVVKSHPDLDPLGSLAGRRAALQARLKRL